MQTMSRTETKNYFTNKKNGLATVFLILFIPSIELSDVCADFFKLMLCLVISASDEMRSAVLVFGNPL